MITDLELLYIKNLHNGKDDTKTLASKIGINQSMLYDIEAGRRNLTKDIFNKITNYYNVTYDNRRSIYDEAYNLTLELFSYIITYEDDKLDDLYDRYKSQIESYHNTKAFILCDLIEAIRNKYDNDDIVEQQLLNCCDFLDVYDNNLIFIYCILWCFTKDVYKETKTLEKIVLDSYKRYSLVGVNEDIVAMLYYQIGRIHEAKHENFEALNYFDKSITAFQNIHNLQRTIQVKIQKANCYFDLKDYDKAEAEYLRMFEESSKYGFKRRMSACANNLAFLYFLKRDFENSLKFIEQARLNGTIVPNINYYQAYIHFKINDLCTTRKELKYLIDNEVDISTLHSLKLIQSFINKKDKNVEHYMDLAIKDFKKLNSTLDIQLIYEMVLDYYKDRNPQRVKELLPEYIKLIR